MECRPVHRKAVGLIPSRVQVQALLRVRILEAASRCFSLLSPLLSLSLKSVKNIYTQVRI